MRLIVRSITSVVALAACCSSAGAQTTALYLDSQPGDYIGQGVQQTWTSPELTFRVSSASQSNVSLQADDFPAGSTWWYLNFAAPVSGFLAPGIYEDAIRYPFESPAMPGLSVSGSGRGCNTSTGRFIVYEFVMNAAGQVQRFAADFEQHCEDGGPALFGAIRFNAARASLLPFDGAYPVYSLRIDSTPYGNVAAAGIDCGDGGTDCQKTYAVDTTVTLTVNPAPGYTFLGWTGSCSNGLLATVVTVNRRKACTPVFDAIPGGGQPAPPRTASTLFLESQPGDFVGGGQRWVMTSSASTFSAQRAQPNVIALDVRTADGSAWNLVFASPQGTTLTSGTYEQAVLYPNQSSLRPALRVGGCAGVAGRFVVYDIAIDGSGQVQRFAADFEQHCGDTAPALFGAIRFNAARAALIPFDGAYPVYSIHIAETQYGRVIGPGLDCGNGGTDCDETYASSTTIALTLTTSDAYQFLGWSGDCQGGLNPTSVTVSRRRVCTPVWDAIPGFATPVPVPPAVLFLDSQPGDFIGAGQRRVMLAADARFSLTGTASHVSVDLAAVDGTLWSLRFTAPEGTSLSPGVYDAATRDGFHSPLKPGLEISGSGRGCNRLWGRFVIHEYALDTSGQVQRFAADFEQHCDDGLPALLGAIRFNSTQGFVDPRPTLGQLYTLRVLASPNGSVQTSRMNCRLSVDSRPDCEQENSAGEPVAITAVAAPGYVFVGWAGDCSGAAATVLVLSHRKTCRAIFDSLPGESLPLPDLGAGSLFFASQTGDFIGRGERRVWIVSDTRFLVRSSTSRIVEFDVTTPDGEQWDLSFAAPAGNILRLGDFDGATRYPFQAPSVPGMSISGHGSGCNQLTARFRIHQIEFDSAGALKAFAADFEQHCEGIASALVGAIRYNSARASLTPFRPTGSPTRPPTDIDGDRRPDLVWRHIVSGHNGVWLMNGLDARVTSFLGPEYAKQISDLNWEIRAVADLNGDHHPDLIWQNKATGVLGVWYLSGYTSIGTTFIYGPTPFETDLNWKIVAAGDMDRDGLVDLLWRHQTSGAMRLWHMNGSLKWDSVTLPTVSDTQWEIAGLADMNGDGWLDLLWRHYGDGSLATWYMRDMQVLNTLWISPRIADVNWRIVGIADMNGDNNPDLVWQHIATGQVGVWLMHGIETSSTAFLNPSAVGDTNWRIVGVR
jgi:hypothetical protein